MNETSLNGEPVSWDLPHLRSAKHWDFCRISAGATLRAKLLSLSLLLWCFGSGFSELQAGFCTAVCSRSLLMHTAGDSTKISKTFPSVYLSRAPCLPSEKTKIVEWMFLRGTKAKDPPQKKNMLKHSREIIQY